MVITEQRVMATLAHSNPVPDIEDIDLVEVGATDYLATLERSSEMTQLETDTKEQVIGKKPIGVWLVAAAAALILGAAILLVTQGSEEAPVATEPTPPTIVEPLSEVGPGEVQLSIDPLVVVGAPSPVPEFEIASLGTEVPLIEVSDYSVIVDPVKAAPDIGGLIKVTVVGVTERGVGAAILETSLLPCLWVGTQSDFSCPAMLPLNTPIVTTRNLAGAMTWGPLPADTSVVTLRYGNTSVWQRPVAGMLLVDTDMGEGEEFELTAFDTNGNEILTEAATYSR